MKIPKHHIFTLMDVTAALRLIQDKVEEIAEETGSGIDANIITLRASRPPMPPPAHLDDVASHLHDATSILRRITGETYTARADALWADD
jgi:hypothetical protein